MDKEKDMKKTEKKGMTLVELLAPLETFKR
jgi:hypothetical protein